MFATTEQVVVRVDEQHVGGLIDAGKLGEGLTKGVLASHHIAETGGAHHQIARQIVATVLGRLTSLSPVSGARFSAPVSAAGGQ